MLLLPRTLLRSVELSKRKFPPRGSRRPRISRARGRLCIGGGVASRELASLRSLSSFSLVGDDRLPMLGRLRVSECWDLSIILGALGRCWILGLEVLGSSADARGSTSNPLKSEDTLLIRH